MTRYHSEVQATSDVLQFLLAPEPACVINQIISDSGSVFPTPRFCCNNGSDFQPWNIAFTITTFEWACTLISTQLNLFFPVIACIFA